MKDRQDRKSEGAEETDKAPTGVTLPPIDATPEEIAKALFKVKPEGETEKPA